MTDPTQPEKADGSGYDPWAPPESRPSMDSAPPGGGPPPPSVHDQATVTSMPSTGGFPPPGAPYGTPPGGPSPYDTGSAPGPGPVPPPPVAPTGPAGPSGGYGYPGYAQSYGVGYPGAPMAAPQNGMGTAAMVLGILACALFCVYGVVSVVLGILAIIFGIKGRKRAEQGLATNHGQAQAGLITGIIGLIIGIAVVVLIIFGIASAISDFNEYDEPPYYDDPYADSAYSAPLDPTHTG
ncbi:DUF4190 domain-containing protein [Streptomyces sp. NPDC088789]|uniref:DUF4190 domain-containing protein n=1 Tax=Streptomyces sp. NPDC088789 TaxID=3365899 RepID=UPI00381DCCCD